jgi:hypothetical protein
MTGAAAAMWRFWHQRNYLSTGRIWLERLLATSDHRTTMVAQGPAEATYNLAFVP